LTSRHFQTDHRVKAALARDDYGVARRLLQCMNILLLFDKKVGKSRKKAYQEMLTLLGELNDRRCDACSWKYLAEYG
jgi:hypothetical protein